MPRHRSSKRQLLKSGSVFIWCVLGDFNLNVSKQLVTNDHLNKKIDAVNFMSTKIAAFSASDEGQPEENAT